MAGRAIVTGASRGIGLSTAHRLAAAGHGVTRVARGFPDGPVPGMEDILLDVADPAAVERSLSGIEADVLVLNAAYGSMTGKSFEQSPEDIRALVSVNIEGVLNCLRAVIPGMRHRDRGHVVLIGSAAGHHPLPGMSTYAATKAALASLAASLRLELVGGAIRVTEIAPGRVRTGIHAGLVGGDRAKADELFYDGYECLEPEDVAEAVAFVTGLPARADVTFLELMPTRQVNGGAMFPKTT